MTNTPVPDRDPCDDLLRAPASAGNPLFRQALLQRTQGLLRRRRWAKRLGLTAALAACYAAGIGTVRLAEGPTPPRQTVVQREVESPPQPAAPPSPVALEWQALDSPHPRPDIYRQAGDRYAAEGGDYESALRCYRSALSSGPEKDLAIQPNDNWLLMALKEAHQKEKQYAKSGE